LSKEDSIKKGEPAPWGVRKQKKQGISGNYKNSVKYERERGKGGTTERKKRSLKQKKNCKKAKIGGRRQTEEERKRTRPK